MRDSDSALLTYQREEERYARGRETLAAPQVLQGRGASPGSSACPPSPGAAQPRPVGGPAPLLHVWRPFYNFPYTFGYLFSTGLFQRAQAEGLAFARLDTGQWR